MSITAMKQALEALEDTTKHIFLGDKNGVEANIRAHKQCESLRQAIAEAEKQEQGEPVAWLHPDWPKHYKQLTSPVVTYPTNGWKPLYTHPQPKREPLTDEAIDEIPFALFAPDQNGMSATEALREFARAIEAAHGIKENT